MGCGAESIAVAPPRAPLGKPDGPASHLWLLSDSQLHNVAGTATRSKSALMEKVSEVAIRPPSLDLWSEVVLSDIGEKMTREDADSPVFFLGDAANVSCVGEYARFLDVMRPLPWLGVPGNHDGYYLGSGTFRPRPNSLPAENRWHGACQHSEAPEWISALADLEKEFIESRTAPPYRSRGELGVLTKTHTVWMYLRELANRVNVRDDNRPENVSSWKRSLDQQRYEYSLDGTYQHDGVSLGLSIRAHIAAYEDGKDSRPWQAMILQDVTLPDGAHVLLIDTTDYFYMMLTSWTQLGKYALASLDGCRDYTADISVPGTCGEVGSRQYQMIQERVRSWHAGTRFFVMGHHPWSTLRKSSLALLDELRAHPGFITYVSAHAHQPASTKHNDLALPWEINIGSTTDWPMEYSRLRYWPNETGAAGRGLELAVRYVDSEKSCPYVSIDKAEQEASAEADYEDIERYLARALAVQEHMLRYVDERLWRGPRSSTLVHLRYRLAELRHRFTRLRRDQDAAWSDVPAVKYGLLVERPALIDAQRRLLAETFAFDRWLRDRIPQLRQLEIACAVWAAAVECEKHDCWAKKVRGIGGDKRGTFSFRIPPGTFPQPKP